MSTSTRISYMISPKHKAFTLVELLVVVAIIGILVAILLPALNTVRESARGNTCTANLKNIALAMQMYESNRRSLPPSRNGDGGWSAQAVITPFLEQGHVYEGIDFTQSYDGILLNGQLISSYRVPIYNCPSEPEIQLRVSGSEIHAPINYAVNEGTWAVWDPETSTAGDGVFFPESGVRMRQIKDGLSYTVMLSEVKTYNPYFRDLGAADGLAMPTNPTDICDGSYGGSAKPNSGHTEWVDGRVHQTGFTTTFTPNAGGTCSNGYVDADFTNAREGNFTDRITYAAVTARSHHPGRVFMATVAGSVYSVPDEIELGVWQAMSTRNGRESVDTSLFTN